MIDDRHKSGLLANCYRAHRITFHEYRKRFLEFLTRI